MEAQWKQVIVLSRNGTANEATAAPARFAAPKPRMRSHTKSRHGCLKCKERKVKCQETRPACKNCNRKGLSCVYPDPQPRERQLWTKREHTDAASLRDISLPCSVGESSLNLSDLRLLHHFILYAHPHLPVGHGRVWVNDVPACAFRQPFLMRSILGLAATHLGTSDPTFSSVGLSHRQIAIRGVNEAMSAGPSLSPSELDVLLAACYALTIQASYLDDGFEEFITLLRGCGLVAESISARQPDSPLMFNFNDSSHLEEMALRLDLEVLVDRRIIEAAALSLQSIQEICQSSAQRKFHASLVAAVEALRSDIWTGYIYFTKIYLTILSLSQADVEQLTGSFQVESQILQVHFLAVQAIFSPISAYEAGERAKTAPISIMLFWVEQICEKQRFQKKLAAFTAWPQRVAEAPKRLGNKGWLSLQSLAELVMREPTAFL